MAENVDFNKANRILNEAFENDEVLDDSISRKIISILKGNHKTYKYILINGLLAKATNQMINALALQAGAPMQGAFDARSLCHNVLVPFERTHLENALGGSNEPFLNKPARFTHLSNSNAVRKGADKAALNSLISIFSQIDNSLAAQSYLTSALQYIKLQIKENRLLQGINIKYNPTLLETLNFIYKFLEKSFEGETCSIIVGALEKNYHKKFKINFEVFAHKVNQSGASSKEIGDIDIYKEGDFYYSIEIKDKNFTLHDLEHAFDKMKSQGANKGQFIFGPHASFDKDLLKARIDEFERQGFMVMFNDIFSYCRMIIFKTDITEKQEFIDLIFETALEINCKKETTIWIHTVLEELEWKG